MADGGKLIIKIDGDTKGFYDKTGQINKFTSTALKSIAKGAAAVGAAMVTIGTLSIKNFADYEQLVGGVDTLFKTSSQKLQKYAAEAYKTAGISANTYMENVTSFSASLLSSLAGDTEKAADVANMALTDMSDNSNKMGTSMESITMAYQGFAKQQYMLLDNLKLGYGGTKTEMERLLKDAQAISGVKYDISNLADVYNAIHVIQTELGITGTTAKEASTTITGSFKMAKAALDNLLVGIADPSQDIDVLVENFVSSVKTVIDNVMPRIKAVAEEFASLFIAYIPEWFKSAISAVSSFATALAGLKLIMLINDLANAKKSLKDFTAATKLGTAAQKLFNAELAANPYAIAFVALTALIAGIATYAATHKSAAKEIREAYDEEIKSIEETQQKEMAQAETADYLRDRLFELEKQIHSNTTSEEEAKKAKAEFTSVAKQLKEIIPETAQYIGDETDAFCVQKDAVNDLTDAFIKLTVAKARAAAYEAKIQASQDALIDIEQQLKPYETGEKNKYNDSYGVKRWNAASGDIENLRVYNATYAELLHTKQEINLEQKGILDDYAKVYEEFGDLLQDSEDNKTGIVTGGIADRTNATKEGAKKQNDIIKEQYETDLKNLELYRELGVISEEEYYDELGKIRDKYFDKDSQEWEDHTLEIIEAQAKAVVEASKELKEKQTDFADNLKDSTALYHTVDVEAGDGSFSYMTLSDTNARADMIEKYIANLEKLKAKGNIPKALWEEIGKMSLEDGLAFTNVLLGSSEDKVNNYIAGWQRIQDASEKASREFFQEESEELAKHTADDFASLAESFFGVGQDGAEQFGEGFAEKLADVLATIKANLQATVSSVLPTAGDYGFTGGGDFAMGGNKYFTIYLTPNDDSTHSQIKETENFFTRMNLSGGY